MRFEDLTAAQRQEEDSFVTRLTQAGWNPNATAELLRAGISVVPEGHATLETDRARLGVELFLETRSVHLSIQSLASEDKARLRFHYHHNLDDVLQWITSRQGTLTVETFTEALDQMIRICQKVVYVDDEGNMYQIGREDSERK